MTSKSPKENKEIVKQEHDNNYYTNKNLRNVNFLKSKLLNKNSCRNNSNGTISQSKGIKNIQQK